MGRLRRNQQAFNAPSGSAADYLYRGIAAYRLDAISISDLVRLDDAHGMSDAKRLAAR